MEFIFTEKNIPPNASVREKLPSPRASIFLAIASKALAFIKHRSYVIPEDVRDVGRSILRHRILLTFEAEAEEITTEEIITQIFESIPTP